MTPSVKISLYALQGYLLLTVGSRVLSSAAAPFHWQALSGIPPISEPEAGCGFWRHLLLHRTIQRFPSAKMPTSGKQENIPPAQ